MTTERPRRIFGRTSLALAGAAVLAPVVGFLTLRRDWAGHDMTLELMAETFVVTMFAVVAAGVLAVGALIAGGIGLARKEPDRWTGGVGLSLGSIVAAVVLAVAAVVYSSTDHRASGTKPAAAGTKPAAAPAPVPPAIPKPQAAGESPK